MANPAISLVIPAWNEAAYLPRLLDSVDAARGRFRHGPTAVEVIVADNGSTDKTPGIAADRGCRVIPVEKRCIAAARNGGAAAAQSEFIAFADADFLIDPESFNYIDTVTATGRYVGGATGLTMARWSWGIRATWLLILPPLWLLSLDGGIWFCRRADFEAVGGYNEQMRAAEDVHFLAELKRHGRSERPKQRMSERFTARKLGIRRAMVINSTRKFDEHGDWHMLRDVLKNAPLVLLRRWQRIDQHIERYWYQGR